MAMYKDTDISVAFIKENFPTIASELSKGNEITLESLKKDYPNLVQTLHDEGKASVESLDEKGVITAERDRILNIQSLHVSGYESVISEAINVGASVSDTKIKLFDAMQEKQANAKTSFVKEGEALGKQVAELTPSNEDGKSDAYGLEKQKNVNAMLGVKQ